MFLEEDTFMKIASEAGHEQQVAKGGVRKEKRISIFVLIPWHIWKMVNTDALNNNLNYPLEMWQEMSRKCLQERNS